MAELLTSKQQTPGELSREIERRFMVAVMEADDAFEKAGATGTKTWVREFLLNRLEVHGLGIGMKDRLPSAPETGCKPHRELSATERLHNVCDALSEQADESPFTREEWDTVDRQTVRLTSALRGMIDAVRNVEIDGPSWKRFIAHPLQSAYRALKHEDPLSPLAAAVEIARGEPPTEPVRFSEKSTTEPSHG